MAEGREKKRGRDRVSTRSETRGHRRGGGARPSIETRVGVDRRLVVASWDVEVGRTLGDSEAKVSATTTPSAPRSVGSLDPNPRGPTVSPRALGRATLLYKRGPRSRQAKTLDDDDETDDGRRTTTVRSRPCLASERARLGPLFSVARHSPFKCVSIDRPSSLDERCSRIVCALSFPLRRQSGVLGATQLLKCVFNSSLQNLSAAGDFREIASFPDFSQLSVQSSFLQLCSFPHFPVLDSRSIAEVAGSIRLDWAVHSRVGAKEREAQPRRRDPA